MLGLKAHLFGVGVYFFRPTDWRVVASFNYHFYLDKGGLVIKNIIIFIEFIRWP